MVFVIGHYAIEREKIDMHVIDRQEMDSKDKKGGKTKKKIDLKEIITSFSNIFTTDDIK